MTKAVRLDENTIKELETEIKTEFVNRSFEIDLAVERQYCHMFMSAPFEYARPSNDIVELYLSGQYGELPPEEIEKRIARQAVLPQIGATIEAD